LVPFVNFSKCVATEVVLFSIVVFKTLTFHKLMLRHTWAVVRYLVTVGLLLCLLQMLSWLRQWNKFEHPSIFDEVKAYEVKQKSVPVFLGHPVEWVLHVSWLSSTRNC